MKKNYIIVGDNNYWFHTLTNATEKELKTEINRVKKGIKQGLFDGVDKHDVEELKVFETVSEQTIEM